MGRRLQPARTKSISTNDSRLSQHSAAVVQQQPWLIRYAWLHRGGWRHTDARMHALLLYCCLYSVATCTPSLCICTALQPTQSKAARRESFTIARHTQTERAFQKQLGVNVGYVLRYMHMAGVFDVFVHWAVGDDMPSSTTTTPRCCCHSFRKATKKAPGKFGQRYYKNVGLGFRTPRDAIEGASVLVSVLHYSATNTPQGPTSTRSAPSPATSPSVAASCRVRCCECTTCDVHRTPLDTGIVKSTKMHRTIIVRRDYLHYIKKYQRFEKRHTNIAAHISPCFRAKEGDLVTIGQCRCCVLTLSLHTLHTTILHPGRCPRRCVSTCCASCHRGPTLARASRGFRHSML